MFWNKKNFFKCYEILLNLSIKFAIFVHFQWHEQKSTIFCQHWTVFSSHFNNIYLKYFRLLQNLMRNYEILQKFTKVNEHLRYSTRVKKFSGENNSLSFICDVICCLSLLLLVISKFDHIILVLLRQFQNFELSNLPIVKVKKVNIADT